MTRSLPLALLAVLAAACSTYDLRYRYQPRPQEVEVQAADRTAARVLVSVLGIRKAGIEDLPAGAELRILVENPGPEPLRPAWTEARLLAADLEAFDAPRLLEGGGEVPPRSETLARLLFPFLPGLERSDLDLDGLHLRLPLEAGGEEILATATFTRRKDRPGYPRIWHDPWFYPYWYTCGWISCPGHFGYGGTVCH